MIGSLQTCFRSAPILLYIPLMKNIYLLAILILCLNPMAYSQGFVVCRENEKSKDDFFVLVNLCNEKGNLVQRNYNFAKTGGPYSQYGYSQDKVVEIRGWNIDRQLVAQYRINHLNDQTWIRDSFDTKTGELKERHQYSGPIEEGVNPLLLRSWFLRNGISAEINTYQPGTDDIVLRQILNNQGLVETQYRIQYVSQPKKAYAPKYIQSVSLLDGKGTEIGNYERNQHVDPFQILSELKLSPAEKLKIKEEYLRPKEPVMIIDSGFDLTHPELLMKAGGNRSEILNGIDDDGNGWIDDLHGWNALRKSNAIDDSMLLPANGPPISHGTHVVSLALRGTSNFSFLGYAGNMTDVNLLSKAKAELRRLKIRFANMSFGWESEDTSRGNSPFSPGADSSFVLEDLVKDSPQTLFLAAAGNSYAELELGKSCEIPPCLDYPNIIKVGALNVPDASASNLEKAEKADFSNYSSRFVDLFAPGDYVIAAGIGNQQIPLSGTSMATPFTLNILLKMAEMNPRLKILQLKEILLKTVYISDLKNPLPARSGGILNPVRAFEVTRRTLAAPQRAIDDLVFEARKTGPLFKGEHSQTAEELLQFWKLRRL